MKPSTAPAARRTFIGAAASLCLLAASGAALAQAAWPTKTVRIVVGFAPGGTTDVMAACHRPGPDRGAGPDRDRREQARRQRQHRRRRSDQGRARRLHRAGRADLGGDGQPLAVQVQHPALARPDAGDGHRPHADVPDHAPGPGGQGPEAADRAGQGQPGQAVLRLLGHRHAAAAGGRALQAEHRHLHHPRARTAAPRPRCRT